MERQKPTAEKEEMDTDLKDAMFAKRRTYVKRLSE